MPKTKFVLKSIIIFSMAMLFLGSMAVGVSPDLNVKARFSGTIPSIGANYGSGLFSGQIVSIALNPQPEPPIYRIGAKVGRGIFSGLIVYTAINPQPEPPGASNTH
ncbi:MAG: hypothetical protein WCG94_00320 [Methanothrix sp.]